MIRSQAAYLLPKGYPQETVTAQAPVRFSYLKLQNGRRVLLRANYIGQDPMTQRYNNYFAHVVTDLSPDFTAADAVRKWESSFWIRHDFDGPANLDEPKQISDGSITPRQVAEFARSHKDLVKFILTTLLFGPKNARVQLATNPEQVILSVAVVAQCLPLSLREDLTFSTYEYDPETSFARIVGTCWHESVPHDLSSMAYQPNGGGYNTLTGRKASLTTASAFIEAAVEAVANQRGQELEAFFGFWKDLQSKEMTLLDLAYRAFSGQDLTNQELRKASETPALLKRWIQKPANLEVLKTQSFQDPAIRSAVLPVAAPLLRAHKPEDHAALVAQVWQLGLKAWTDARNPSALQTGKIYIEEMLPQLIDPKTAIWKELLGKIQQPAALAWNVREYLLAKFISAGLSLRSDPDLSAWLRVSVEQLPLLLQSAELNEDFRKIGALECIKQAGLSEALVNALATRQTLAWDVVLTLMRDDKQRPLAVDLWQKLLKRQYPNLVEKTLQLLPAERDFAEGCLAQGIRQGLLEPVAFVRSQGHQGMRRFSSPELLKRLAASAGRECLQNETWQGDLLALLQSGSTEPWFPDGEMGGQLRALLILNEFFERPATYRARLAEIAQTLQQLAPQAPVGKTAQNQVVERLPELLLDAARTEPRRIQTFLENILVTFGSGRAGGSAGLLDKLWLELASQAKTWKTPELVEAFVCIYFGQTSNPKLTEIGQRTKSIAPKLPDLIQDRAPHLLTRIDDSAAKWDNRPRMSWLDAYKKHLKKRDEQPVQKGRDHFLRNTIVLLCVTVISALVLWDNLIKPYVMSFVRKLLRGVNGD